MAVTKLSNSELANLVKQWKPSNEWDYDPKNKYAGTNIKLGDGSLVPYDAIVKQCLARYDQDKKNPTLAVKSGTELGIPDDVLKTLPGVDEDAFIAGKQLISSGAFNVGDTAEGSAANVIAAPVGSETYKARMAAGLDAYGYPPAQVEALRASGQYREPTTSLSDIAQAAPATAAPAAGTTPLSNITQAAAPAAAAPAAQKQYTDAEIINAIKGSREQGFNDQQIIQGAQANFGLSADRINSLIKTVPAPQAAAPAAAQTAAQGPAVKDASGNIIGYQSTQGAPGAVQVQTGQNRDGPVYSWLTPPSGQYATQLQTGTDRAGNPIYSNQSIITPQAQQTAGQAAASTFVEPSWVAKAPQTIGTAVEPVYPMKTVHGGNQEPDTSQAPIGYRYDNGQSQYQYLDLAGTPTNLVNRGNLGEAIKTLAPIAISMIGANFLGPALNDLFGPAASDLFGGGGDFGMGAGAGGAGTSINEMIASGLAPGSAGAYGAAAGALTPEALAAAAGTGLTALAPAALTPAAIESLSGTAGYGTNASAVNAAIQAGINPAIVGSGAGLTIADLLAGTTGAANTAALPATTSLNEMIASGTGPGSAGAYGATTGALTGAGLAAAGGLTTAGSTLAELAATGAKALTPAAIESLAGTAGYGTNASAIQAAIDAGINPAIVGSGAGLTIADLLAGTTGASTLGGLPAATSVNEMVASGLTPGSAGAAGAATGALTGSALAAAAGTGLTNALGSGIIDTLVQKAKDAISTGSPAASSLVDQLKNATGLTGTQLAALLSGGVGAGNAANLTSAINTGLDATTAANTASQGVLKDIYNQQLGFQQPYQATGVKGLNQINQLADTGYLTHQFNAADLAAGLAPNYDFMLQQGQMANQRAANVGGGALSGNTLQGLNRYTQDYAGNAYQNAFTNYQNQRNNIYTNLAGMAGIGQTANTGAQAAGTSYGKGTTDLQTALANAQAAAAIGKAQAVAGGTSGLANSTFLASLLAPPKVT
jgi:hypothetical protein